MTWLFDLIGGSGLAVPLIAAVSAVAGALGLYWRGKKKGAQDTRREAVEDAHERVEQGRDHLRDNRDDDPDERLRRNDGKW